jgi:hypothetical protein
LNAGPPTGRLYIISLDPAFGSEGGSQNLAGALDIEGPAYRSTGSDGGYLVLDEIQRFRTSGVHPVFELAYSPSVLLPAASCTPPCLAESAASKLESFLKDRDLLNFEYRLQPSPSIPRQVEIFRLLDGAPLISPYGPAITALTGESGELLWLRGNMVGLDPGDERNLISAAQAWQALKDGSAGVVFQDYTHGAVRPRTWSRRYAPGEDLTIFGEALTYVPADETGEPLILLNEYRLTGETKGLAEAAIGGRIIQAWGRTHEDNPNGPEIEITGWQASVYPEQTIEGRLARAGGEAYLVTGAARYRLPDTPVEINDDTYLNARGVMSDAGEPAFEWWALSEGPAQRVRTGGPGFAPLSVEDGDAALPPALTGRIDGVQGIPKIIVHSYSDGSSQVEVQFELTTEDGAVTQSRARLDGPGLQGIEAYHNLPVRIWGQAGETTAGLTAIEVERFEPVHPGVRVEAWLGMAEQAEANGRPVWLVTTPDGESFVLGSTLDGQPPAADAALLRDPIIVEGVQIPGNTLLDFPIINDLLILPGVGRLDVEGYSPLSAQPRVLQAPGTAGARRTARIDAAEIVYVLTTETGQLAESVRAAWDAQPAWRFSGRFEDGAYFEILVQAAITP